MQKGFLYLVAIMDWATRRVLSWRLLRRFRFFGQSDKLTSTGPKRNETWA
jgi:hypothetical protein